MQAANPEQGGKWGIMGGVFDPIHYGHLRLAEQARISFNLDGVLFVVSFNPPHRQMMPVASFEDRLAIVNLAIKDNRNFVASDIEKNLAGPGYTVSLVTALKSAYPEVSWYLIMGADNLGIFDSWHKPEELIRETKIIVGNRPGYGKDLENSKWKNHISTFDMPLLDISSTMIRRLCGQKQSIQYLVPDEVRRYIDEKELYL